MLLTMGASNRRAMASSFFEKTSSLEGVSSRKGKEHRFGVHLIDPLHKHYHMTCALRLNARPQQSIGGLEFAPASQLFAVIRVEIIGRQARGTESPSARDKT